MKKQKLTTKTFTILYYNSYRISQRAIALFEKSGYEIATLIQSQTDINDMSILSIEVEIPAEKAELYTKRIRKIIGVAEISISFGDFIRLGYYAFHPEIIKGELIQEILQQGGVIIECTADSILIQKMGTEAALNSFYEKFENQYLIGYCEHIRPIIHPSLYSEEDSGNIQANEDYCFNTSSEDLNLR
ncbi:hypothetical protein [Pedobacter aquatilis]|uniref:hypothetical protein n=1 Tax=Pedobacter aquatilis TaxID=351343 RepID=UPI00292EFDB0|nr:hypothetical protein [Pedobacter aquatilis]